MAFKELKSLRVLVHFDHVKNREQETPPGFDQIRHTAGVNLPYALVTTADGKNGVHAISAKSIHTDLNDAVRKAKKKLADMDVVGDIDGSAADDDHDGDGKSPDGKKAKTKNKTWTNKEGKTITATPLEINDETVKFRLTNGKVISYPINKLSDESQRALQSYFDDL